jgi:transposase-like protein
VVRGSVEETLNALLDAEADRLCNAQRYERSAARRDTRAGHYERNLQTKACEVRLKVPQLRQALIEELPDSATASAHAFMSSTGSRPIATHPQTMKW